MVVVTLAGAPAMAESDLCQAVALTDVDGWNGEVRTGPPDIVLHKGETYDEISVYDEDPKTGLGTFCTHGGGCVDRYVVRNGVKVEALRLVNCSIRRAAQPSPYAKDPEFELVLDRSKVAAPTLRYNDIDTRLLQLGMCNACADGAANEYLRHPQSACSQTVRSALEGSPDAAEDLSIENRGGPCGHIHSLPSDETATTLVDAPSPTTATAAPPPAAGVPSPKPEAPPSAHAASKIILVVMVIVLAAAVYFLPTVIAFARHKRNLPGIFALNLLLGWTFLGWVASLVWSVVRDGPITEASPESP